MTDQELELLLSDLESDRVERTSSVRDKDKLCEAICAFSNDLPNHQKPGIYFIGVYDDGRCADLAITDQLLRDIAGIRSDGNILPFPEMIVQKRVLLDCEVAAVIVQPSYAPPVRYKGRTWIRVGPRKATATPQEERSLSEKRRSSDIPFDIRTVPGASLEDLDLGFFCDTYLPTAISPDVLELNQRTVNERLMSVRFIAKTGSPTNLGILSVGNEPRQFLPGAYVQFLRIDGQEITDPIKDQKELSGHLLQILRQLDEVLQLNISTSTDFTTGSVESKWPDYPIAALQQIARNAILHRTYEATNSPVRITWFSDRLEILNPGGPFGQSTPSNFGQPGVTDYRNPNLAEVMKNLGYVQRFGLGIAIAKKELEKNGNPELYFDVNFDQVLAVLKRRKEN
ncbi:ATP-binding protein [Gloeobacter morelensis]|uniref:DNA binding domain-containing protein n=1 Tax=Gloeobacter morelensis MG652769 TaxID=2781736 RepID=A0ABY3PTK9_9CYAN|nr:ATP-binding protein [Gloeobacter morelensis]UFP96847.1 putative DNA binding domain-containing protein [Gloeobacter morelensis MG652769]